MRKYIVIIFALILVLSSCKGYREIEVGDVQLEKFKLESASKINLTIRVDIHNPTKAEFNLSNIEGVVYRDDIPFANLSLLENTIVPASFTGPVSVKCRIDLLDPMAVLVMGLNVKSWKLDEFTMKIKATVKKGMIKKSIKLNNIPLNKLAKKIKF